MSYGWRIHTPQASVGIGRTPSEGSGGAGPCARHRGAALGCRVRRGADGASLSAMDAGPALAPSMAVGSFYGRGSCEPRSANPAKISSMPGGIKPTVSSGYQLEPARQRGAARGFTEEPWSAVVV
jgi:hypothetical protein